MSDSAEDVETADSEKVAVGRDVLAELVESAKGQLEADVSRWGPEKTGYDVDAFAETIQRAEESLEEGVLPADSVRSRSEDDEMEFGKVRIHEEGEREFDIGSSFSCDKILYLKLPIDDVRGIRNWAAEELSEAEYTVEEECSSCEEPADARGYLSTGEEIYLHGNDYCLQERDAS